MRRDRKSLRLGRDERKIVIASQLPTTPISLRRLEIVGTGAGTEIASALDAIVRLALCATGDPTRCHAVRADQRGDPALPATYMDKVACGPAGLA